MGMKARCSWKNPIEVVTQLVLTEQRAFIPIYKNSKRDFLRNPHEGDASAFVGLIEAADVAIGTNRQRTV
jgi:hypothetical protein